VFLNPAAQQLFGGSSLRLQSGLELRGVSVAGGRVRARSPVPGHRLIC